MRDRTSEAKLEDFMTMSVRAYVTTGIAVGTGILLTTAPGSAGPRRRRAPGCYDGCYSATAAPAGPGMPDYRFGWAPRSAAPNFVDDQQKNDLGAIG